MSKEFLSTILITTAEALENCLKYSPTVFCIEEPLFSEIHETVNTDSRLSGYDIHVHSSDHYIVLLRRTPPRPFDPQKHCFIYHPIPYRPE